MRRRPQPRRRYHLLHYLELVGDTTAYTSPGITDLVVDFVHFAVSMANNAEASSPPGLWIYPSLVLGVVDQTLY